jgi:FHS family L-fucose permease-like MFS transporter
MNAMTTSYRGPLVILTLLFFLWGFITCLNDILIPQLKSVFILNYAEIMLVQFCFFAAYFFVSLPSGLLVERFGFQKGIVLGLSIASLGCLLFYPSAALISYPFFLFSFFILASGITLLQVAANPFVTILGPSETASIRLNMTQAFNSLGTTIAPYIGSLFISDSTPKSPAELNALNADALVHYQTAQAEFVQLPYLSLAAGLGVLAFIFALIRLPAVGYAPKQQAAKQAGHAWQYRHLLLGAVGIFLYVGAEVSIGSFLISFISEDQIAGLTYKEAGKFVSFYWGGAMAGRFVGALLMRRIKPRLLLAFNAIAAVFLLILTLTSSGSIAMWSLISIGLCNSIMFPTIFSLALTGLGSHSGEGSGVLCMAIVGGALVPVLQGWIADRTGLHLSFFLPALCYSYIAYYGWKGYRPGNSLIRFSSL